MAEKKIVFPRTKSIRAKQLSFSSKRKKKSRDLVKERRLVGAVLLFTAGLSLVFYFINNWKSKVILTPEIKFSWQNSLWRNSLSDKIQKVVPRKFHKNPENLGAEIALLLVGQEDQWAIWVEELEGGFVWTHQEDEVFTAASLIKLPTVATLYDQVETGELDLDQEVALQESDFRGGAGSLANSPMGTKVSLRELAFLSLNHSDNTAFTVLRRVLGDETIEQTTFEWGMKETSLENNLTSAADIALFFRKLYGGELLNDNNRKEFLEGLTKTAFEIRIPQGVPEGIRVAHKIGNEIGVIADAGIVFVPDSPLLLVFLSKNVSSEGGEKMIVDLTQKIYWFLASSD